jgi:hypothetical protein
MKLCALLLAVLIAGCANQRAECLSKPHHDWVAVTHVIPTHCECTPDMVGAGLCTARGATVIGHCPAYPIMGCRKTQGGYVAERKSYHTPGQIPWLEDE